MKATDYLEKWYDKLVNAGEKENEVLAEIITDFGKELKEIVEQRKAKKGKAIAAIFKEQNQKYNKFCRLVNAKAGVTYLKEDGLKRYWIMKNPQLKELIR